MADPAGTYEGLMIQRHYPPSRWIEQLEKLASDVREAAEQYLRQEAAKFRCMQEIARACGCRSMDEFDDLKRQAKRANAPSAQAWVNAGRPEKWSYGN